MRFCSRCFARLRSLHKRLFIATRSEHSAAHERLLAATRSAFSTAHECLLVATRPALLITHCRLFSFTLSGLANCHALDARRFSSGCEAHHSRWRARISSGSRRRKLPSRSLLHSTQAPPCTYLWSRWPWLQTFPVKYLFRPWWIASLREIISVMTRTYRPCQSAP